MLTRLSRNSDVPTMLSCLYLNVTAVGCQNVKGPVHMFEVQIETNPALLLKVTLISSFSICTSLPSFRVPFQTEKSFRFSFIFVNLPNGGILMLHISLGWCNSTVVKPHVYFGYCTRISRPSNMLTNTILII